MKSQDLFSAIESIDSELLYDARTYHAPKIYNLKRAAIAAAVILTMLAGILIYAIFVAPVAFISLESKAYVLLSVNARGYVLSVTSDHKDFSSVQGKQIMTAVEEITKQMIAKSDLCEDENTLLLGTNAFYQDDTIKTIADLFEKEGFSGSAVSVVMDQKTFQPDESCPAKKALINLLTTDSKCFTYDSLKDLSVNDLNLLIKELNLTGNNIYCLADPSESKYIGKEAALTAATENTRFSAIDSSEVQLTVYQRKLAYLITLRSGENAEVCFISASDGVNEHTIRTTAEKAPQAIDNAVKSSNEPSSQEISSPADYAIAKENPATESIKETVPDDQPASLPQTEPPQPAPSSDYTSIPLTMRELSFTTMTPPASAAGVAFDTVFEGQYIEERSGDKKNEGSLCVISNLNQWNKFLSKNNKQYLDENGNYYSDSFTKEYFDTHTLLVSACVFSDASYYTAISDIDMENDTLYIDDSLSYGDQKSGVYYCHTLSVYELDKSALSPDMTINVY